MAARSTTPGDLFDPVQESVHKTLTEARHKSWVVSEERQEQNRQVNFEERVNFGVCVQKPCTKHIRQAGFGREGQRNKTLIQNFKKNTCCTEQEITQPQEKKQKTLTTYNYTPSSFTQSERERCRKQE